MRVGIALALALMGCGLAGGGDGSDSDGGNGSGDGGGGGNGDGGGSNTSGFCSDPAKLIFTLEGNKRLSKFDPVAIDPNSGLPGRFTTVGFLNCPGSSAFFTPFSMGIDRDAVAWVLYRDYTDPNVAPQLFRVDTTTLQCDTTSWATQNGIKLFGIGFSTEQPDGIEDTMYITGGTSTSSSTSTLATLSTSTFVSSVVGPMNGWSELSGNAKAELWAFLPLGSTPTLQQINKTTGATLQTLTLSTLTGSVVAWAFAWWGGDFWLFHKRSGEPATKIYQVDGVTGAIKNTIDTNSVLPREIVGAGVSTCAPVILL